MWWKAFKYVLVGTLFWAIGALFLGGDLRFYAQSEPAQLIVVRLDSKQDHSTRYNQSGPLSRHSKTLYRPVFTLDTPTPPHPEYAGNTWMSPAPHQAGDKVAGRYDPASGKMQSDRMMTKTLWLSAFAQFIGLLAIVQGILMFFGVPEFVMPLRVR